MDIINLQIQILTYFRKKVPYSNAEDSAYFELCNKDLEVIYSPIDEDMGKIESVYKKYMIQKKIVTVKHTDKAYKKYIPILDDDNKFFMLFVLIGYLDVIDDVGSYMNEYFEKLSISDSNPTNIRNFKKNKKDPKVEEIEQTIDPNNGNEIVNGNTILRRLKKEEKQRKAENEFFGSSLTLMSSSPSNKSETQTNNTNNNNKQSSSSYSKDNKQQPTSQYNNYNRSNYQYSNNQNRNNNNYNFNNKNNVNNTNNKKNSNNSNVSKNETKVSNPEEFETLVFINRKDKKPLTNDDYFAIDKYFPSTRKKFSHSYKYMIVYLKNVMTNKEKSKMLDINYNFYMSEQFNVKKETDQIVLMKLFLLLDKPKPFSDLSSLYEMKSNFEEIMILKFLLDNKEELKNDIFKFFHIYNNEVLYETIKEYFSANCKISLICNRLKIHRNTFTNRVKAMSKIMKRDLSSINGIVVVYTIYVLYKNLKDNVKDFLVLNLK